MTDIKVTIVRSYLSLHKHTCMHAHKQRERGRKGWREGGMEGERDHLFEKNPEIIVEIHRKC